MTDYKLVFDVESMGLHGEGFAVGAVVVDGEGREVDPRFPLTRHGLLAIRKRLGQPESAEVRLSPMRFREVREDSAARRFGLTAAGPWRRGFWQHAWMTTRTNAGGRGRTRCTRLRPSSTRTSGRDALTSCRPTTL